jgi:cell division transport system permease protein
MHRHLRRLRKILAPRLDIPFARDDTNRYLPWFIALMVFLTGLFIAGGITVGEVAKHKRMDLSQWVTIQIPESKTSEAEAKKVVRELTAMPAMEKVVRKKDAEVQKLIAPWFGDGKHATELPLPVLIEARWKNGTKQQIEDLRRRLKVLAPSVEIDDHQYWLQHYLNFIRMMEVASYLLALLVVGATTLMIVFTSKTALKLHEDAIWLLHSVGAVDDYIARQFQFNAFLLGMRGALAGTAFSALVFFLIGFVTAQFNAPLLPSLPITGFHITVWLLLPPLTGLLAMNVARRTVLAMLRKMA